MQVNADAVADVVLEQFRKLPSKRKPQSRGNGLYEWVPMSGIVAEVDGNLHCIALATGMKCLPSAKLSQAQGNVIHDWHAEVLALRALNHYLLSECHRLAGAGANETSLLLRPRTDAELDEVRGSDVWQSQPFCVKEDVAFYMYGSEAPCGDASMELIMASQEDASPWTVPEGISGVEETRSLPGRGYFSQLGVVRRKPARGDAPPTMSKSCSDKLALRQCTSLLSSVATLLIHPQNAYLQGLVLPESQLSRTGCERCFSNDGRMRPLKDQGWEGGFGFRPFQVQGTSREFGFSKRSIQSVADRIAASNLAAAWTIGGLDEGLINGVLQGRKAFDIRGASSTSRRRSWTLARESLMKLSSKRPIIELTLEHLSYRQLKAGSHLHGRRQVLEHVKDVALVGWVPNTGDDDFELHL